jgi:hypothetical protein
MDLLLNYKLRKLTDEQIKYFIELDKKNQVYWDKFGRKIKPSIIEFSAGSNKYFVLNGLLAKI